MSCIAFGYMDIMANRIILISGTKQQQQRQPPQHSYTNIVMSDRGDIILGADWKPKTKCYTEKYNLCVPFFTQRWTFYLLAKDQRAFLNGFYFSKFCSAEFRLSFFCCCCFPLLIFNVVVVAGVFSFVGDIVFFHSFSLAFYVDLVRYDGFSHFPYKLYSQGR